MAGPGADMHIFRHPEDREIEARLPRMQGGQPGVLSGDSPRFGLSAAESSAGFAHCHLP